MKKDDVFNLDGVDRKVSSVTPTFVFAGVNGKKGRPSKFNRAELETKLAVTFEVDSPDPVSKPRGTAVETPVTEAVTESAVETPEVAEETPVMSTETITAEQVGTVESVIPDLTDKPGFTVTGFLGSVVNSLVNLL